MKEKRFIKALREAEHPMRSNDYAKEQVSMSQLEENGNESPHHYYYLDPIPLSGRKIW